MSIVVYDKNSVKLFMDEIYQRFLSPRMAGVIANCISKWFDGK